MNESYVEYFGRKRETNLDPLLSILTHANCLSYDLMADTDSYTSKTSVKRFLLKEIPSSNLLHKGGRTVWSWAPPGTQCVDIGAADSTVRDLDIDVALTPRLGFGEFLPDHLALGRVFVEATPSFEFVVGLACHGDLGLKSDYCMCEVEVGACFGKS